MTETTRKETMNPNEAAKRIGTELGQSNPKGDARLAVALNQPTTQHKVGDLVETYFDTGAMGVQILYGKVIASGPKRFTVRWESNLCNRLRQATKAVTPARDQEGAAQALAK